MTPRFDSVSYGQLLRSWRGPEPFSGGCGWGLIADAPSKGGLVLGLIADAPITVCGVLI
jgi:hypothetical protein